MRITTHSPKYRELVWKASSAEDGTVTCNICGLPVLPGDDWDVSHMPVPHALGGREAGVGHRRCNRRHNAEDVTPRVAKAKRQARKHAGIEGPGLSVRPMPWGRRSGFKKTMQKGITKRFTQAEQHRRFMAQRYGVANDN